MLTIPVTISWTAPVQLYGGTLQQYSVSVMETSTAVSVHSQSVDPSSTSLSTTLMVLPFESYTVTVSATTGGGISSDSIMVLSPEAGIRYFGYFALHIIYLSIWALILKNHYI